MAEPDNDNRWDTVHLQTDQLEQVLATDMVETVKIDLTATPAAERSRPGYSAVLLSLAVAIVSGAGVLLLDSGLWTVGWATAGKAGFGIVALLGAGVAGFLLARRSG